jgi:hypothetical protein
VCHGREATLRRARPHRPEVCVGVRQGYSPLRTVHRAGECSIRLTEQQCGHQLQIKAIVNDQDQLSLAILDGRSRIVQVDLA